MTTDNLIHYAYLLIVLNCVRSYQLNRLLEIVLTCVTYLSKALMYISFACHSVYYVVITILNSSQTLLIYSKVSQQIVHMFIC